MGNRSPSKGGPFCLARVCDCPRTGVVREGAAPHNTPQHKFKGPLQGVLMKNVRKSNGSRTCFRHALVRKAAARLHNFESGTRWVVRPDGESYGSCNSSHDSLARSAGYANEDQAYAKGALRVHYDPATNAVRIEARRATPSAIALVKQIINKVPAALAHVAIGEGSNFRSYLGKPTHVAAEISRPRLAPPCAGSRVWRLLLPDAALQCA